MALSKKSGLFSSANQRVARWPTYTWLAKLLMRDYVTSVRVPLLRRIYTYTVQAFKPESGSESLTDFYLHYIQGSDPRLSEAMAILVACSSDHVDRRLWACAFHNLARTWMSASEEITTRSLHVVTSSDTDILDKILGNGLGSVWTQNINSLVLIASKLGQRSLM